DLDRRIADSTSYVNQRLGQIATLNQQISEGLANGHEPNDLMDQRDVLINEVATKLQVTRDDQADGTVDLYTAGGMSLVVSNRAATLVTQQSASNPVRSEVAVELDGQNLPLTESTLGSGEIVGLLRMRDSDVHAAEARLGQLAAAFAGAFNKQQAMGLDMAGNVGKPMFSVADARARAGATNTGNATVQLSVQDSSKLKATDYELTSLGNNVYRLRNTVDGHTRELTHLPVEIDGLKIEVNGTMASGDVFQLQTATAFATSMRSTLASGRELATASPLSVSMNRDNGGSVKLVNMTQQQTSPDMGQPVTIEFTGADKFSVTGQGTGNPVDQTYVPGQPIQFNGWSLTLNGTPAIGDKVEMKKITPNARDNGNANAMVLLADRPLVDGANFNEAFGSLLSDMGARTLAAKNADSGSKALLESSKTALSNRSGVNLDEEAALLLQYRQAYQAAAKVIQTADEMFTTILSLAR
ncbi:MAG: flagellar basal body rod C-terminal domain-containing protein, partial [Lautropia sp.]|nr:flagellar basal body rod C-terminal domain-containing protein [Lautropia sp.]